MKCRPGTRGTPISSRSSAAASPSWPAQAPVSSTAGRSGLPLRFRYGRVEVGLPNAERVGGRAQAAGPVQVDVGEDVVLLVVLGRRHHNAAWVDDPAAAEEHGVPLLSH